MKKQKIERNVEITITPRPIPFVLGLCLWAYAVFYHMDMWGAVISGIGFLLYGHSIAKCKVEKTLKKWKKNKKNK